MAKSSSKVAPVDGISETKPSINNHSVQDQKHRTLKRKMSKAELHHDTETVNTCFFNQRVYYPYERWRRIWDTVLAIALFYSCIFVPYEVGFDIFLKAGSFMFVLDLLVDCFFLTDCALNFNVAVIDDEGEMISNPIEIRRIYLRGWFTIDLGTSIPVAAITLIFTGGDAPNNLEFQKLLRIVRILRLFKLLRMARFVVMMSRWESDASIRFILTKAVMLLVVICTCTHFMACLFAWTAVLEADDDGVLASASWPTRYLDVTNTDDMGDSEVYLWALYWGVVTITTVGYGDVSPQTNFEIAVVIVAVVASCCVFGYIMGSVASVIAYENLNLRLSKSRISEVTCWMHAHKVPHELRYRIEKHFVHRWKSHGLINTAELISELPFFLREEVAKSITKNLFGKVPFIQSIVRNRPSALTRVVLAMKPCRAIAGQVVIRKGDHGVSMYIIHRGTLVQYPCRVRQFDDEGNFHPTFVDDSHTNLQSNAGDVGKRREDLTLQEKSTSVEAKLKVGQIMELKDADHLDLNEDDLPYYKAGDYFAEYTLIPDENSDGVAKTNNEDAEISYICHPFSVVAKKPSDLYQLSRLDFIQIQHDFFPHLFLGKMIKKCHAHLTKRTSTTTRGSRYRR
eukprot:g2588.t1